MACLPEVRSNNLTIIIWNITNINSSLLTQLKYPYQYLIARHLTVVNNLNFFPKFVDIILLDHYCYGVFAQGLLFSVNKAHSIFKQSICLFVLCSYSGPCLGFPDKIQFLKSTLASIWSSQAYFSVLA